MKKFDIKNYFSKKLYFEALNQSKITGFFAIIASIIICSIFPFSSLVSYMQYASRQQGAYFVSVLEGNFALLILMYQVPIFLAFNGFEFLSKRKACDFYHAIPVKRQSIYCSFALAGVTWLVSSLLLGGLCSTLFFASVPNLYIPIGGCFQIIGSVICGALLIYFASLIAIFASGNKLTQILLAFAIVFLPYTIKNVLFGMVDDITGVTTLSNIVVTIPLVPICALFGYSTLDFGGYFEPTVILATLVVAIIFAILAGVIFFVRKSELAENNAPNKFLQHVYRLVLMIPFIMFFTSVVTNSSDVFSVMIPVVAISIVIYVAYELATTKNYKTAIKSLPYYGVVVIATIMLLVVVNLTAIISNQITPSASQINYVQFTRNTSGSVESKNEEYYIEKYAHKITDEEIINIISTRLEDTINSNGLTYLMEENNGNQSFYRVYVTINTGIFSYDREVLVSEEEKNIIDNYYANLTDLNELVIYIPEKEEILNVEIYGSGIDNNNTIISDEVKSTVVDMFYDEFYSLSQEEQYKILVNNSSPSIMPVFAAEDTSYVPNEFDFRLNLTTLEKYDSELTTVYITSFLPKTYEYILNYAYENQSTISSEEIDNFIVTIDDNSEVYMQISICGQNDEEIIFSSSCTADTNPSVDDCVYMLEAIKKISNNGTIENSDNLYAIEIQVENLYYNYDYNESYSDVVAETYIDFDFIASLTSEDLQIFKDMQIKQLQNNN
ncbi:MAG: hypothetical protein R3Y32_07790 [Bacillota bacterium]